MMKTDQQKALEKIKKLLKLAGNQGAMGNEAANALSQANALLKKYQLTMTDVELTAVNKHPQKSTVKAKPTKWETGLASAVAEIMGCEIVFTPGFYSGERGYWNFIGIDVMPGLAGYAFDVLLRQLKRDRAEYVKTALKRCKPATKSSRAVKFCEAWVVAIYKKVEQLANKQPASPALAAYMEKHYSKATELKNRANPKGKTQVGDSEAGYSAGKKAELNRGVAGNQAETALLSGG